MQQQQQTKCKSKVANVKTTKTTKFNRFIINNKQQFSSPQFCGSKCRLGAWLCAHAVVCSFAGDSALPCCIPINMMWIYYLGFFVLIARAVEKSRFDRGQWSRCYNREQLSFSVVGTNKNDHELDRERTLCANQTMAIGMIFRYIKCQIQRRWLLQFDCIFSADVRVRRQQLKTIMMNGTASITRERERKTFEWLALFPNQSGVPVNDLHFLFQSRCWPVLHLKNGIY